MAAKVGGAEGRGGGKNVDQVVSHFKGVECLLVLFVHSLPVIALGGGIRFDFSDERQRRNIHRDVDFEGGFEEGVEPVVSAVLTLVVDDVVFTLVDVTARLGKSDGLGNKGAAGRSDDGVDGTRHVRQLSAQSHGAGLDDVNVGGGKDEIVDTATQGGAELDERNSTCIDRDGLVGAKGLEFGATGPEEDLVAGGEGILI